MRADARSGVLSRSLTSFPIWTWLWVVVVTAAPARAHSLTLGAFSGSTAASFASTPGWVGAEVAYAFEQPHFAVQGGLRAAAPLAASPLPLEVFARFVLRFRLRAWEPLLGPEIGLTGLRFFEAPRAGRPTELFVLEQSTSALAYMAMHAAPLRFVVLERFLVSALELQVGTSLVAPGATVRTQIQLVSAGVRW